MAKLPSAQEIVNKMMTRAQGAGADWKAGIERSRGSITSGMKAAAGRYKNEMLAALNEDRWGKAIAGLTDDQIIAAALAVGDGAWLNGLTSRKEKVQAALERFLPRLQAHVDKINALPTDTPQQRTAKMVANLEGMRALGLAR